MYEYCSCFYLKAYELLAGRNSLFCGMDSFFGELLMVSWGNIFIPCAVIMGAEVCFHVKYLLLGFHSTSN